ncbi:hypothetical protein [Kibdelosporangium aridum]|uniref:hypothetical protein n=1 Tax=Kibdelosporangium aridum TaxID=2030 RepID=UPI00068F5524
MNIVFLRAPTGFFLNGTANGFEFQLVLGAAALALLFTGAGRFSVDARTPWPHRPILYSLAGLIVATVSSAAVLLLFH